MIFSAAADSLTLANAAGFHHSVPPVRPRQHPPHRGVACLRGAVHPSLPSGATTRLRPPRLRNVSSMRTVRLPPLGLISAEDIMRLSAARRWAACR